MSKIGWLDGNSYPHDEDTDRLGVLSIPLVFDTLGMIPGIIVLLAIAVITTWVGVLDYATDVVPLH